MVAFGASLATVGWEATLDYALQRVERDGVLSPGRTWNQLQLSNIPIALGTIGLSSLFVTHPEGTVPALNRRLRLAGLVCLAATALLAVSITLITWPGWDAFLNPRWLAHSLREAATHPFTAIPIALASIIMTERSLSGRDR